MKRSWASMAGPVAALFLVAIVAWVILSFAAPGPHSWLIQAAILAVAVLAAVYLFSLLFILGRTPNQVGSTSGARNKGDRGTASHFLDSLTGLPGRLWIVQTLTSEIARIRRYHRRLSVLIVDIDHFSHLNRRLGEATGDRVLEAIGRLLRSHIRQSDHFGRLRDDQFVVVVTETPQKGALQLAEKLRGVVESERLDRGVVVTVSIGMAAARDSDSAESLLQRAEAATMTARRRGGNGVATTTF